MHNALQGQKVNLTPAMLQHYREVNAENAKKFTWEADFVVVNDPQPAFLIEDMRVPRGKPGSGAATSISPARTGMSGGICAAPSANMTPPSSPWPNSPRLLPHPQFLLSPSINPLSEKNRDLSPGRGAGSVRPPGGGTG